MFCYIYVFGAILARVPFLFLLKTIEDYFIVLVHRWSWRNFKNKPQTVSNWLKCVDNTFDALVPSPYTSNGTPMFKQEDLGPTPDYYKHSLHYTELKVKGYDNIAFKGSIFLCFWMCATKTGILIVTR